MKTLWLHGYVQVYTGDGKGKTTAALGVALRVVGAGGRVFVGQFLKARPTSEAAAFRQWPEQVTWRTYGRTEFVLSIPDEEDRRLAQAGWAEASAAVLSGDYNLIVLDELAVAVELGMIPLDAVLDLLRRRPANSEVIITGRDAAPELVASADLVTEMREVKHYFSAGVGARYGIEE